MIGFWPGGFLVAEVSTHFKNRLYAPVDPPDQLSSRPDFAIAIYPGHLSLAKDSIVLNPEIKSQITSRHPRHTAYERLLRVPCGATGSLMVRGAGLQRALSSAYG